MEDILQRIAEKTKERIVYCENVISKGELQRRIGERELKEKSSGRILPDFLGALSSPGMTYICEVKKASPSKGLIAEDFPYMEIAKEYEEAGAGAISCLTEPHWFMGNDSYVENISENVCIPVLRKDFTISEYMVLQARAIGASAILLITSILDDTELKAYRQLAESLDMQALVEIHDEAEAERALDSGARIIGVNNRNLRDFTVDTGNSIRLRSIIPKDRIFVSESGIKTSEDISKLYDIGVDAVLIGETLMRSGDKRKALQELNGGSLPGGSMQ